MEICEHKIAVAWNGLPAYGAHLVKAARIRLGYDFPVVGTRPDVPIEGMEHILGGGLYWVEENCRHSWAELGLEVPRLFVHTGWRYPHFVSLADEVRAAGGKVVGMFDNSWKGNVRQWVGAVYFRLFLRHKFSAAWVPGLSGRKLARRIGVHSQRIHEGLYGANPNVFQCKVPICERPKKILFVGRLIDRKGIVELLSAFEVLRTEHPDWQLEVIGNGPHAELLQGREGVNVKPFCQPDRIAIAMNEARVLALPSHEEHWGLVVHEAALCGCALLLTQAVGAGADLVRSQNGICVAKTSVEQLKQGLEHVYAWAPEQWTQASELSVDLAQDFGPVRWADEMSEFVRKFLKVE
ncbi:glycosyltransferase [Coraliomargarita sp. SDUM461004]|uniref:Glycosyltransferase n=1 Tax=Thalassobacterium sedimentorum TaxID=3041258 RepID=A0ABU1ALA9_9BACT|nr:glycosyltransferase [Coraliomargarita sp. SDUM461004]MDQ8195587.1 glycosyltransferase [Coraliomargarita sp. SDUM461004]